MFTSKKEDKFFVILVKSAENVEKSTKLLRASLDDLKEKENNMVKIEALEDEGNELVITMTKELDEAFVTPIDREDIYEIIKCMDNILDLISSAMHRFIMFHIEESTDECKKLCDLLISITTSVTKLLEELKDNGFKSNTLRERINKIAKIENEADDLFRKTVTVLFEDESDVLKIIKWKEIYQIIEDTIDSCKEVANIIEGVVIKNA